MSAQTVTDQPIDRVLPRLDRVRSSGPNQWSARCPAHEDRNPSLSIAVGLDGRVLLHCHGGCAFDDVLAALDLGPRDLFPERPAGHGDYVVVAEYKYCDEHGELLYVVERRFPKDFRQRRPDGAGGWIWKLDNVQRVPYRMPELCRGIRDGERVFIVEGERDVDRLRAEGLVATCNSGGAGKWQREFSEDFAGADVVIIPDNDDVGIDHAHRVAHTLA